jgi:hypothetical protein
MSRYPDSPRPASPYPFRFNRPYIAGGPEWVMQARALTRYDLLECDLNYRGKSWAEIEVIAAFFRSVDGAAGRFTFVDFNGIGIIGGSDPGVPWKSLFVRQGTGSGTGPWDLPTFSINEAMSFVSSIVFPGPTTVNPSSMDGIVPGVTLDVANLDGTAFEQIVVTSVGGSSFTATYAIAKTSPWCINPPVVYENGVQKITEWNTTTPAAGHYGVKPGTGTDGLDSLYAGTATADGVIVSISATCRRAMRHAHFVAPKRGFSLNVPVNYFGDVVTIAEVRT